MAKVIYLTGAPAAGKSSTVARLREVEPSIQIFEYGAMLTEMVKERFADIRGQEDIRTHSALLIRPEDIVEMDRRLLAFVDEHRGRRTVLIDSHAVTKESYGFRITAFSTAQIRELNPDEIWVFFASPQETRRRISEAPGGRPLISEEEARMHTTIQASVAATYGIMAPSPVYLFDTEQDHDTLISQLQERLQ
ncbi:ATP-binding protein [Azorhizobium sp. AG788]|uniref:ATP-binding protein n=1 Tax=Azorhizobium sp. AG788 TaxID=2183897 RepID=UPI001415042B|nr:ATP-binding protein [Azorhizobium sp. AG788]